VSYKKVVFIAFAIEDERQRDFFVGQSWNARSPFEFVDMSVKEPYDRDWKNRVRTRIRRSDGVIALISKSTLTSSGQKWEINCAIEERKPLLGIWVYKNDRTFPAQMSGRKIVEWTWNAIASFIDRL
jgi:antiphage defense system Thoeris ThsB-like protein